MDGVREKNGPHSVELSPSEPHTTLSPSPFLLTSTPSLRSLFSLLNWSFLLLFFSLLPFSSLPSLTHSTLLTSPAVLVQTNPCSLQPPSLLPSGKRFLPALLSTLSTTPTSTAFSLPL